MSVSPKLLVALLASLVAYALVSLDLTALLDGSLLLISRFRSLGPFAFVLLYVLTCILLLPGFALTYGAGALYGVPAGLCLVSTGLTAGATCAFLLSRYAFRDWAQERFRTDPSFGRVMRGIEQHGALVVFLARLCPVVPFRFSNYAFGITSVRTVPFILATWLGTLPSATFYVSLGAMLGSLPQLAAGSQRAAIGWKVQALGFTAMLLIFLVATCVSRRYLQRLETPGEPYDAGHRGDERSMVPVTEHKLR